MKIFYEAAFLKVIIGNINKKQLQMKTVHSILFFLFFNAFSIVYSQSTIKGNFSKTPEKEIVLNGFNIEGNNQLGKAKTDAKGNFSITYPSAYVGAAMLEIKDIKSVIVLLNKENFEMKWDNPEDFSTLTFINSPENSNLSRGLTLYQNIEGKRAGLTYLIPLYKQEPVSQIFLEKELKLQDQSFADFLASLPKDSYALYYIKLRKLLSDMPMTASKYGERFIENEKEFTSLDFGDKRMDNSGLYKDLFEGYVQLMESLAGNDIDKLKNHVNSGIDAVLKTLKNKPVLLQEMSRTFFNILEKRSLFASAEHLALAMLDESSCQLDEKHEALFEQYRKMAIGKIAPEIVFPDKVKEYNKLSDLKSKYRLVVFGASWCTKCTEELPKLKPFYDNWKKNDGLEIVFVSLDQDKTAFSNFSSSFPWVSSCDYKSWEGQAAKDYCVFATPTMYLLDANQKIVAKPISADHLEAILKMYRASTNAQ